jgi:sarcosine oxidase subunit alpha
MRRLPAPERPAITVHLDGEEVTAREGEPVACSLLAAGERIFSRSVKYHRPRGPFCFASACTQCLMQVDGVPNVYTCQVPARAGMRLERQNAFPSARLDVFAATDFFFPKGLDHHQMFAGVPVAEQVMLQVARHLAGLGKLPTAPAPERAEYEELSTDVALVGAGVAGLVAARELTAAGVDFLLLEKDSGWSAIGLYEDDRGRFIAAICDQRLRLIRARRFLLAMGGHPQLIAFENNDLPGVYAARAAAELMLKHRLLPGDEVAVVGVEPEISSVASLLEAHGAKVVARVNTGAGDEPLRALGRGRVRGLAYLRSDAKGRSKVRCDAILLAPPVAPRYELARQGGAHVAFDPVSGVFTVQADPDGRTANPEVFVAGEMTGALSVAETEERARRTALVIAEEVKR